MTVPRLFAPGVQAGDAIVRLPSDEAHHLLRVLRARVGDDVRVFDGRGREWAGRLTAGTGRSATVALEREVAPVPEPPVRVTLAAGLLKGDQMDAVVRDATMLGAAAIVPMVTAHVTVPARAWQSGAASERWRRVAVASAKQCGRATVPDLAGVEPFAKVMASAGVGAVVMCVEPAVAVRAPGAGVPPTPPVSALVLVGPEGGWAPAEVEQAAAAGAVFLSLGPRTLRAESAPVVALTALWSRWGW